MDEGVVEGCENTRNTEDEFTLKAISQKKKSGVIDYAGSPSLT